MSATLTGVIDSVGGKIGRLRNGATTDDNVLALVGTGTAGEIVAIYDGTLKLGSVTVGADGRWLYHTPQLADGQHQLRAAYEGSTEYSDSYTITVDAPFSLAPQTPYNFGRFAGGVSNTGAFAALTSDGSVVTWGNADYGGDSSAIATSISSNVVQVFSTYSAFAALKRGGSVVTWGEGGGDSSAVESSLSRDVVQVFSTGYAFAALKSDGSVITWGDSSGGGSSSALGSLLSSGVVQVFSTYSAFAALKEDGSVITWGNSSGGGNSGAVGLSLSSGVVQVFSTDSAFAALKEDGSVITWGNSGNGGDSRAVRSSLSSGVVQIFSTSLAFVALKNDGSVVTWGNESYGGDSSGATDGLTNVVSFGTPYDERDKAAPVFVKAETSKDGKKIFIIFDEGLRATTAVAGNFIVSVTDKNGSSSDLVAGTDFTVAVSGRRIVLTLVDSKAIKIEHSVKVAYNKPMSADGNSNTDRAIQDMAGNDAASIPETSVTNNAPPPPPTLDTSAPIFVTSDGQSIMLTFHEDLDAAATFNIADFTVLRTYPNGTRRMLSGADFQGAAASGKTVTLTLATATAAITTGETVAITYVGDDIKTVAGGVLASNTISGAAVTNNSTVIPPAPTLDTSEPIMIIPEGHVIILAFHEDLDAAARFDTADFTVTFTDANGIKGTLTGADFEYAHANGKYVILYFKAPLTSADTAVTITYTGDDIKTLAGGVLASNTISGASVTNNSAVQPAAPTLDMSAPISVASDGHSITLTFKENLDGTVSFVTADFTVTVTDAAGISRTLSAEDFQGAVASGKAVTLTLATATAAITTGETVAITYVGGDIKTVAGGVLASNTISGAAVTNNSTVIPPAPTLDTSAPIRIVPEGSVIILTFNQGLDVNARLDTADFTVTFTDANGIKQTLTGADFEYAHANGKHVILQFKALLTSADKDVTITYTGDDIKTVAGGVLASNTISGAPVTNNSAVQPAAPTLDTSAPISVASDGHSITLTFNENLDGTVSFDTADFTVTVTDAAGISRTLNAEDFQGAVASGKAVTLTLATATAAITTGETVAITYVGGDIKTVAGGVLASNTISGAPVTNNSATAPAAPTLDTTTPISVAPDGHSITLTFNENLDDTVSFDTADFTVTVTDAAGISRTLKGTDFQGAVASGKAVTLKLVAAITSADTSLSITYVGDDIKTVAGGVLASNTISGSVVTNNSTVPPVVAVPVPTLDTTTPISVASDGHSITLTFNENLDGTVSFDTADFTVTVTDAAGISRTLKGTDFQGAVASGKAVTLKLVAAITKADTSLSITYVGDDIKTVAGGVLAGNTISGSVVTNNSTVPAPVLDRTAPEFVSAEIGTDGKVVTLSYNEELHDTVAGKTAFEVKVNDIVVAVNDVSVVGQTVKLTLATAVFAGQVVKVGYTAPTADATSSNPAIQDKAGNDAVSLTSRLADNKSTLPGPTTPAEVGADNKHDVFTASAVNTTKTMLKNLADYVLEHKGAHISINEKGAVADHLVGFTKLVFKDGSIDLTSHSALFDPVFYAIDNLDVFRAGMGSFEHYQNFGITERRDPNAFFDVSGYLAVHKDVAAAGLDALQHFIHNGAAEGRDTSASFDVRLYLQNNADVAASGLNALEHYLQFGRAEGRQNYEAIGEKIAADGFDEQHYLFSNADVVAAGMDARTHFTDFGFKEGRSANILFDPTDYLVRNPDVAAAGMDPLEHYNDFGWREGRAASSEFNTGAYLADNLDVAAAGINPLMHYLQHGVYEGRQIEEA